MRLFCTSKILENIPPVAQNWSVSKAMLWHLGQCQFLCWIGGLSGIGVVDSYRFRQLGAGGSKLSPWPDLHHPVLAMRGVFLFWEIAGQ